MFFSIFVVYSKIFYLLQKEKNRRLLLTTKVRDKHYPELCYLLMEHPDNDVSQYEGS